VRIELRNAQEVTEQMKYQQQQQQNQRPLFGAQGSRNPTRLHVHSTANGVNFGGFGYGSSNYADEQLLEGLSDEPRLF
jgi:hypothetical protein